MIQRGGVCSGFSPVNILRLQYVSDTAVPLTMATS
jgi:hypothetical protein